MGNQPSGLNDTYIVKKTTKKNNLREEIEEPNQKSLNQQYNKSPQNQNQIKKKQNQKNELKQNPNPNKNQYHNQYKNYNHEQDNQYKKDSQQYFRQSPTPPPLQQMNNFNDNSYNNSNSYNIKSGYEDDSQTKLREKSYSNTALMERNMVSDIYIDKNRNHMIDYPSNSNNELTDPKKSFENIEFTPYNFNDEVSKYKTTLTNENTEFERNEIERRNNFKKKQSEKEKYLNKHIKLFEEKYDPWSILGLKNGDYNIESIKKAYKKSALKYHPDKAGDKYKDMFQIITQSYIYLLQKAEKNNGEQTKISAPVTNVNYEDNINESVENIYVSKDKFDLNQFNQIFEKYKVPSSYDKGYGDMAKESIGGNGDDQVFGQKFNNDVFNAHFNNVKTKKKMSTSVIEYKDPEALESSLINLNTTFLGGVDDIDDFGSVNASNNLSYTDYRKAHVDETMLIDVNKVNYKTYNSIDHLENERSKLLYEASPEDRRRNEYLERKKLEDDNSRSQRQNQFDNMVEEQYRKINQRLIVHK